MRFTVKVPLPSMAQMWRYKESSGRNSFSTTTNHTAHTEKSTLYILKLNREGKSPWNHQIVMKNRLSERRRDRKEKIER